MDRESRGEGKGFAAVLVSTFVRSFVRVDSHVLFNRSERRKSVSMSQARGRKGEDVPE